MVEAIEPISIAAAVVELHVSQITVHYKYSAMDPLIVLTKD
jgi:hypothetical protein